MSYSTQAKELISVIIMTQRASNSDWSLLCWVLYRCTGPIVNCLLAKHTGKKNHKSKATHAKTTTKTTTTTSTTRQEEGNTLHMETVRQVKWHLTGDCRSM